MTTTTTPEERVFRKLEQSSLYQTYRDAFRTATGLPLELSPMGSGEPGEADHTPLMREGNPFCHSLREDHDCVNCNAAHRCLTDGPSDRVRTVKCFAGFQESSIPVKAGGRTIAYLRTGQVLDHKPEAGEIREVARQLKKEGLAEPEIEELKQIYVKSPVIESEKYRGMTTLLAAFALQLGEELNRLLIAEENTESPVVTKAKHYINAHLDEKITLDAVASHVCVSPYYFCKLFKQTTDMTLTEYVNRRRVEWAKRKLLNPHARVTEVAYDVGYQSLSQFNRSFLKYVGESPTRFRDRQLSDDGLQAA